MPYLHSEVLDDPLSYERFESYGSGMDAFRRSTLLPPDAVQYLENLLIADNDELQTRPGTTNIGAITAGAAKVQGLVYYDSSSGTEHLLMAKDQNIERWNGSSWTTIGTTLLADATLLAEMVQADDLVAISDGTSQWWTWDGSTTPLPQLGNTTLDAPVGATILCWHGKRMFASGIASENDAIYASAILDFSDGNWHHTNYQFRVGGGEGQPIIGMESLHDHYLGVLKSNSIHLVDTNPANDDPTTPTAADWPILQLPTNLGLVGKRAKVKFGNDLMFLAQDGIRSLRRMTSSAQQYEVSPPLSQPMQPYINRINWAHAHKSVAWKRNEYAFFSIPLDSATEPNYTLVWNGRLEKWTGFFSGTVWTPTAAVTTRFSNLERMVFGNSLGQCQQWLDYADKGLESTFQDDDGTYEIAWMAKLRSSWFGEPISDKDGYHLEVRFVDSDGDATIKIFYDEVEVASWTEAISGNGFSLPVDLPFDLYDGKPITVRKGLDSYGTFNEAFIQISGESKRANIKNATMSAFLNTIENE